MVEWIQRQPAVVTCAALLVASACAWAAGSDTPQSLLARYAEDARMADPAFDGFSAERGKAFYFEKHAVTGVGALSCASCHRKDPREQIRAHRVDIPCRACHVINDEEHPQPNEAKVRYIEPFAPLAHPKRFTDYARVEKHFEVNCKMVLKRACTAQEKGDLLAWLLTVEGEALYPAGRVSGPVRAQEE